MNQFKFLSFGSTGWFSCGSYAKRLIHFSILLSLFRFRSFGGVSWLLVSLRNSSGRRRRPNPGDHPSHLSLYSLTPSRQSFFTNKKVENTRNRHDRLRSALPSVPWRRRSPCFFSPPSCSRGPSPTATAAAAASTTRRASLSSPRAPGEIVKRPFSASTRLRAACGLRFHSLGLADGDKRLAGRSCTAASSRTPSATTSSAWWVGLGLGSRIGLSAAPPRASWRWSEARSRTEPFPFCFLLGFRRKAAWRSRWWRITTPGRVWRARRAPAPAPSWPSAR